MTYYEEEDKVVPELRMSVEEEEQNGVFSGGGEYVKLRDCEVEESGFECEDDDEEIGSGLCCWRWRGAVVWYWVKLVFLISCLGLLGYVFLKWVGPFFMDKELMPIINWETTTFSTPVLAVLVFASVALFPTLLLPSTPSMWIAGMTFGYGFGFLLIITATAVGVSLPYFIGILFLHKIQSWLEKYPKKAAILRSAGEGNWLHRFKAVTLIRISPFPYIIYNYCAVATNVKYGPYLIGTLVGMVPEIFVAIYTGILIRALADASHEQHSLSAQQIALNIAGFCASVATTILFTVYAKKKLKTIQDEPLLPVGV